MESNQNVVTLFSLTRGFSVFPPIHYNHFSNTSCVFYAGAYLVGPLFNAHGHPTKPRLSHESTLKSHPLSLKLKNYPILRRSVEVFWWRLDALSIDAVLYPLCSIISGFLYHHSHPKPWQSPMGPSDVRGALIGRVNDFWGEI
jgi:hypothetical protein